MTAWKTTKNADGRGGVRYREHPTRKHGVMPDRYYALSYWWQGKSVSEAVGWASDGWTPTACFDLLRDLKHNQGTGKGPCTLAEMRQMEAERKETEQKRKARERAQTFKAFFDDIYLPDARGRWKPTTTEKAVSHVKKWIHPVTGNTPMRELALVHVNKIKAALVAAGRSARTQQYVMRTFSMVWGAAHDHGYVDRPCPTKHQSFRLPKIDNEKERYLTIAEERTLLEKLMARDRQAHDMAVVALDAGLRFGEIAGLTWGCVDTDQGIVRVLNTKGKKDRLVPMTERLTAIFKAMDTGTSSALVFPDKNGGRHREAPGAFRTAIKDAKLNEGVEDPKLKFSFHGLRHTCASRMVQSGVGLLHVQRILGHSTPAVTARYAKLADEDLRQAIQTMERATRAKAAPSKIIPFQRKGVG